MASKSKVASHKFSYRNSSKNPTYKFRESSEIEIVPSKAQQSDSDENQNEFVVHHSLSFHPSLMLLRTLPKIDAVNKMEETIQDVETFDEGKKQDISNQNSDTRHFSNSLPNFQKSCKCATKRLLKEKVENQTEDKTYRNKNPKRSSLLKQ